MKSKHCVGVSVLSICSAIWPALALAATIAAQDGLPTDVVPTATVPALPWPAAADVPDTTASWHLINSQWTNTATPDEALLGLQATAPKKEIRPTPDGAVADFGRHNTLFPSSASQPVHVTLPGGQVIRWRAAFLAYFDTASGKTILLSDTKDSPAEIQLPDQVIYADCLTDLRANLRYNYQGGPAHSLEQDLIVLERPPPPDAAEWKLSPASTRLELWSEVLAIPPYTKQTHRMELRPADPATGLRETVAVDEALDLGTMKLLSGHVFRLGEEPVGRNRLPVSKTIQHLEGRTFIVESLDYLAVAPWLKDLPEAAVKDAARKVKTQRADLIRSVPIRHAAKPDAQPMKVTQAPSAVTGTLNPQLSALNHAAAGVVLDFIIVASVPVPADIISWWQAQDNANDTITNNHGSLQNGATYANGQVGGSFSFDGVNDYVQVPDAASLNPTNALTLEAWIYVTGNPSNRRNILSKDGESSDRQYLLAVSDLNKLRAYVGISNTFYYLDGVATVQLSNWYHVAMTYEAGQSNLALYLNGVLETNMLVAGPMITTTQAVRIGGGAPGGGSSYSFAGLIDEPSLYRRALSATELWEIYNAGAAGKCIPTCVNPSTNAVGWWPGDGHAYDHARTNFGTLTSGTDYADGEVSKAFRFYGSNSVEIADAPDLNPTNELTVELWVFMTAENWDHRDLVSKDGEWSDRQYLLTVSDISRFRPHVWTANGPNYFDGDTQVELDTWYHVAMTYDGQWLKLYVNGVLDGSSNDPAGPVVPTTQPVRFGGGEPYNSLPYFFTGLVDEPTIYNRALTTNEVSAIYSAGTAGKCKLDSDQDGLTDLQEVFLGTDPNDPDSDHDGLTDGDEVMVHHTNPKNGDTDGDGVSDYVEWLQGRNPLAGALPDTNGVVNLRVFTPLR